MKYKILLLVAVGLMLTGCTQEVFDWFANVFGANTPGGENSPATQGAMAIGDYLPYGLGALFIGITKVAHSAIKTKRALTESTELAILDGSLVGATTPKEIKAALNQAQNLHHDSKRLEKHFDKLKNGGIVTKVLKKTFDLIPNF